MHRFFILDNCHSGNNSSSGLISVLDRFASKYIDIRGSCCARQVNGITKNNTSKWQTTIFMLQYRKKTKALADPHQYPIQTGTRNFLDNLPCLSFLLPPFPVLKRNLLALILIGNMKRSKFTDS
jgi:hypothetical protein